MKRTPLRRASKKRARELRAYSALKQKLLLQNPFCEMEGCVSIATQIHHIRGRAGKMLTDPRYLMLICPSCHRWIHDHAKEARKRGLLK